MSLKTLLYITDRATATQIQTVKYYSLLKCFRSLIAAFSFPFPIKYKDGMWVCAVIHSLQLFLWSVLADREAVV